MSAVTYSNSNEERLDYTKSGNKNISEKSASLSYDRTVLNPMAGEFHPEHFTFQQVQIFLKNVKVLI